MIAQRKRPAIRVGPRLAGFPPDEPAAPASTQVPQTVGSPSVAPAPTNKRGRPSKHGTPMSPAERKAASRASQKTEEDNAERQELIDKLMKIYDRQVSDVVVVGKDRDAIARAEERRGIERQQRRRYLDELKGMALQELRVAVEGKDTPDSRGTLSGESTGGFDSPKVETIIEADRRATEGGRVEPSGTSPDNPTSRGKPDRWAKVPAKEREKQTKMNQKFWDMVDDMFHPPSDVISEGEVVARWHQCKVPDCPFFAKSFDGAVEHLWSEYYAGQKLQDKIAVLSESEVAEIAGGLATEAQINARKSLHYQHYSWIDAWLRSRKKGRIS